MKQPPRAWYPRLHVFLESIGFINSKSDFSLFCFVNDSVSVYILVYVHNIIITSNEIKIHDYITRFFDTFSCRDLVELNFFLGLGCIMNDDGMIMCQRKYMEDILEKYGLISCAPCATPMRTAPKLTKSNGVPLEDATPYGSMVGSLEYLTLTRLDIAYQVNHANPFLQKPIELHLQATY